MKYEIFSDNDFYKDKGNAEWWDFIATQTPILITYLTFLL